MHVGRRVLSMSDPKEKNCVNIPIDVVSAGAGKITNKPRTSEVFEEMRSYTSFALMKAPITKRERSIVEPWVMSMAFVTRNLNEIEAIENVGKPQIVIGILSHHANSNLMLK